MTWSEPRIRNRKATWKIVLTFVLLASLGNIGKAERDEDRLTYVVTLRQPSVVEEVLATQLSGSRQSRRQAIRSAATSDRRRMINQAQLRVIDQLITLRNRLPGFSPDIELLDRRCFLTNSLVIKATPEAATRLARDPEVKGMVLNRIRYPLLDSAPLVVRAPAIWEAIPGGVVNAGREMRIGIIDSGINHEHPMFEGDGLTPPPGFPAGSSSHTNNKVIVARAYPHLFPNPQANRTPDDEMGHGSRVAAVAAGRHVAAPLASVRGIAPLAFLGSYKVFGAPESNTVTTSAAIIAALNDAVSDGMDVINLSLGGPGVDPETDPEQQAIALAVEAGTVVVVAAGNGGPGDASIRSPGTSPDVITVGAVSNARVFGPALAILANPAPPQELAQIPYTAGTQVLIPVPIGPLPLTSIQQLDTTELACDPLTPGSLDGQIALVRRGNCFFQDKADNVFAAGAAAMVVYNNVEGAAIVMSFDDQLGPGGPAVMINRYSGEQLRDLAIQDGGLSAILRAEDDLAAFPSQADIVTGFSSRGPNIDGSIKPDLTAVGSGIYSASNSGSEFTLNSSGTSFSTPLVAGAAALVLQLHQDWTPQTVKSSLVTTADKSPTWEGESARVFLTGNGRLDLEEVLQVSAMVDPVSISFGRIEAEFPEAISLAREFLLQNLTNETRTFDLGYSLTHDNSSAHITLNPSSVELDPFDSIKVEVRLDGISPLLEGALEGYLEIIDKDSSSRLSMALQGMIIVTGQPEILEVSQSGPGPFQDLASAIASARPGVVIEITDSSTYQGPILIHEDNSGTPLDNLTIRSRPGESPVIEGTPGDSTVILVQDVEELTIEGLEIRGPKGGISLNNSTGVIRNNKILSSSAGSEDAGIQLKDSAAHIRENELVWESGTGILASGSEALVQSNMVHTSPTETLGTTTGISADSNSSLAIFDNSIRQTAPIETNGYGIQILDSSALIKSNLISAWGGDVSSGVFAHGDPSLISLQDNLLLGNSGSGVHLAAGAEANVLRDRVASTEGAGLLIEGGSRIVANSVLLTYNDSGLAASESRVTLFNSVFAHSRSDGLFAEECVLEIGNCTVFGNGGVGLRAVSPASGNHIVNSVFSANQNGSLSGVESTEITYNLIGDGQFQGLNGNISGEAALTEPEEANFAPLPNSPVVDAGDNSYVATTGDLLSHHRIEDGDSDGSAIVDLGAIEFGSAFSAPIILPLLTVEPDQWLGFAISNAYQPVSGESDHQDELPDNSTVRFRLRNTDGSNVDQKDLTVPEGTQMTVLLSEEYQDLENGWLSLEASGPDVLGFALMGNWQTSILDGVPLVSSLGRLLVFPEVSSDADQITRLFLANPCGLQASFVLRWHDQAGSVQKDTPPITIPPFGMYQSTTTDLFGLGSGGYIVVEVLTSEPIYAMELLETEEAVAALLALDLDSGTDVLYSAQLASADGVRTVVNVINTGPASAEMTLEAIAEDGEMIATSQRVLSSGAQLRLPADEVFDLQSEADGWLRIRSDATGLLGAVIFQNPNGKWQAALPLQSLPAREFILSHVAHTSSIFTGVTLLNPANERTLVSFEVFNAEGQETGRSELLLSAGHKQARLLHEWIPDFDNQTGGFIRIRSTRGVLGFELFGSWGLDYVSAVPQQVTVY